MESKEHGKEKGKTNFTMKKNNTMNYDTKTVESEIIKYEKMTQNDTSLGKTSSFCTLKFNTIKHCSSAEYYIVQMEFSSHDDKLNIWLKAMFIHDVLKWLAEKDKSDDLFNGFNEVVQCAKTAELRSTQYGPNECKSNKKNSIVYKDFINYYLIPKKMGSFKDTIDLFVQTMVSVLQSSKFFSFMTVYQNKRNDEGGIIGKNLRNKNHDVWNQLNTHENFSLNYLEALNGKFMDDEISHILSQMFPSEYEEEKYQKIGWNNIKSSPWSKSKKNEK